MFRFVHLACLCASLGFGCRLNYDALSVDGETPTTMDPGTLSDRGLDSISPAGADSRNPRMVASTGGFAVLWDNGSTGATVTFLNEVGEAKSEAVVVSATAQASVATSGSTVAVAYRVVEAANDAVRFTEFSLTGQVKNSIVLDTAGGAAVGEPSVSWDGSTYVAAWLRDDTLVYRTIDGNESIVAANAAGVVRVAGSGANRYIALSTSADTTYHQINSAGVIQASANWTFYDAVVDYDVVSVTTGSHTHDLGDGRFFAYVELQDDHGGVSAGKYIMQASTANPLVSIPHFTDDTGGHGAIALRSDGSIAAASVELSFNNASPKVLALRYYTADGSQTGADLEFGATDDSPSIVFSQNKFSMVWSALDGDNNTVRFWQEP